MTCTMFAWCIAAGLYASVALGVLRGTLRYARERSRHMPGPHRRVGTLRTLGYVALSAAWPFSLLIAGTAYAVRGLLREAGGDSNGLRRDR